MRKESEYVGIGKDMLGYKTDSDYVAHGQDFLAHFGTKGQKWGRRRYQNEDGSLTPEGYIHYGYALPDYEYSGPYEGRAEGRGTNAGGSGPNGGRTHYGKDDYVDVKYREIDDEPKERSYKHDPEPDMQEAINRGSQKNQAQESPTKQTMSDREKFLTGLAVAKQVGNNLGGQNSPLRKIAEVDKRKKQAQARAMNSVGIENLTNEQMQAVIDRRAMEKKYLDATTPEVQSGYEKTMEILQMVGAVAATTTAVIGVANAIKQMKG